MKTNFLKSPVFFGLAIAVLLVCLKLLEFSYFSYRIELDVYLAVIAVAFLGLGIYFGATYNKRREERLMRKLREESNKTGFTEPVINYDQVNGTDLSKRELEVLKEIAMGHTNKEIGEKLFVSENTIKTHINNIYMKLEVNRRTQAISKARDLNIIS